MGTKLTDAQRVFLAKLPADGGWKYFAIIRSGTAKAEVAARQQCKNRSLAEPNPDWKRAWRITDAGLKALREASHDN